MLHMVKWATQCHMELYTQGYRRLHMVTLHERLHKAAHGYTRLHRVTLDYKWLYQVTKEYIQLHEATKATLAYHQAEQDYSRLRKNTCKH